MVNNIRIKDNHQNTESPRGDVGEIDTRAPFQSVKAAVSLFGEVVRKRKPTLEKTKSCTNSSENVIDRETQLLLTKREIEKVKQKIDSAETTRSRALSELEKAQRTVQDLTTKLNSAVESKRMAIEATEAVKHKAKHLERVRSQNQAGSKAWKSELDTTRDDYRVAAAELDKAKQELTKLRQDFDSTLEGKLAAFQQAAEAQRLTKVNFEKVAELTNEIHTMQKSLEHLKATSVQAKEEQAKIVTAKDERLEECKRAKEEVDKKLAAVRREYDPELIKDLEVSVVEANGEIEKIKEEMKRIHDSDMDSVKVITAELNEATRELQKVAEEEGIQRNLVSDLRRELESAKKEKVMLGEQEEKIERMVKELQAELEQARIELDEVLRKQAETLEEESNTPKRLTLETDIALKEVEELRKQIEELKQEEEARLKAIAEDERELEAVLKAVEDAKMAEHSAREKIKKLSGKTDGPISSSIEHGNGWIKMPFNEFDSLTRRVEESTNLAEMKLAAATFQMEAMNGKKDESERKREEILKEIKQIEAETEEALKQVEMAEAAKKAIEGELRKRRQQEDDQTWED